MKRALFHTTLMILLGCFALVNTASADLSEDRIRALEDRIEKLESLIEGAGIAIPTGDSSAEEDGTNIGDNITFSSAIEAEAAYGSNKHIGGGNV